MVVIYTISSSIMKLLKATLIGRVQRSLSRCCCEPARVWTHESVSVKLKMWVGVLTVNLRQLRIKSIPKKMIS